MTDFNFDIPERFDTATADDGVWFAIHDENDRLWGEFKCAMIDPEARKTVLLRDRLKVKHAKDIRLKKLDAIVVAREMFLELSLLDWKMTGKDGKAIKFSKEAATAYFNLPSTKYALDALLDYVQDVRNFQKADKEEIAGNS